MKISCVFSQSKTKGIIVDFINTSNGTNCIIIDRDGIIQEVPLPAVKIIDKDYLNEI